MTLRTWLAVYSGLKDSILDKEVLIECPNGLLVTPEIKYKKKDLYQPNTDENVEAVVITP